MTVMAMSKRTSEFIEARFKRGWLGTGASGPKDSPLSEVAPTPGISEDVSVKHHSTGLG